MGPRASLTCAPWRLLLDEEGDAAWNMAVDESILDAVAAGREPPTARFYRWEACAISVGRFQAVDRAIDVAACRRLSVAIVRRPTGGRGVLHGGDQTLSLAVPCRVLGAAGARVLSSYQALNDGVVLGLGRLGLAVAPTVLERREERAGDCFAARARVDLVSGEAGKVVGAAQCRRGGAILQQSSVRHRPARVPSAEVFRGPHPAERYPLCERDSGEVVASLRAGLETSLGAALSPGSLSGWERERARALRHQAIVLAAEQ